MTLTSDVALDPTHVYFVVDQNGDYVVGGTHYSVVTEPDVADISTYYELSRDESLNNYVGTHLAVTSEGLWLLPDAGGNKVLIAVGGQGHTYETAGTYIIGKVNNVDTVFAKFLSNGATMMAENGTQIAHLGYGLGNGESGTATAPYYTLGKRANNSAVGNYSIAEGVNTKAIADASHAEGKDTEASILYSHAEGYITKATSSSIYSGAGAHAEGVSTLAHGASAHAEGFYCEANAGGLQGAHAEGYRTKALALASHSQNYYTIAQCKNQTAIGKYNEADIGDINNEGAYAFIVGNGTADDARSNALTVAWDGNVEMALDTTSASGTDHDLYAAITALGWESEVIV